MTYLDDPPNDSNDDKDVPPESENPQQGPDTDKGEDEDGG